MAQAEVGFSTFKVYGTSKLGGTALTYELARRLRADGDTGVCCAPPPIAASPDLPRQTVLSK